MQGIGRDRCTVAARGTVVVAPGGVAPAARGAGSGRDAGEEAWTEGKGGRSSGKPLEREIALLQRRLKQAEPIIEIQENLPGCWGSP